MKQAMDSLSLFDEAIGKHPLDEIASILGLHPNTVKRWDEQRRVPSEYEGDLKRLLGKPAPIVDQFFTKPNVAEMCYDIFCQAMDKLAVDVSHYTFIEPSAGCGYFYNLLPSDRRIGLDLYPLQKHITKTDYLLWQPEDGNYAAKYIVIGNPPFGLRGHLALQFINHSARFADVVAFILPQLFSSDGKGVPSKRVHKELKLAYSKPIPANSFCRPNGDDVEVSTVFQIWTKINKHLLPKEDSKQCESFVKLYSLSDGGTPSSTRNKHMIGKCDVYLPSTCFTGMGAYTDFEKLPHRRGYGIVIHRHKAQIKHMLLNNDWRKTAFTSTNGALNLRGSMICQVVTTGGFCDE